MTHDLALLASSSLACEPVDVAPTDSRREDLNENLSFTDHRIGQLRDDEIPPVLENQRLHTPHFRHARSVGAGS